MLSACTKEPDPVIEEAAPVLVSTVPENGATDIQGTGIDVKFTYDQNIKCPLEAQSGISADGGCSITGISAYNETLTVTLSGLEGGKTYTVSVPAGAVQGYKQNQKATQSAKVSFTTYLKPTYTLNPDASPVNPKASARTRKVYEFLLEQSGKKILSGVQSDGTGNNNDHSNAIASKTGKHPALVGYDFLFIQYSPTPDSWSWKVDYSDMSAPAEQWEKNGLVNYMWHWNVPKTQEDWQKAKEYRTNGYGFEGYAFYTESTNFDIREALKEGTWQHEFILSDIEKVAGYLKILADKDIPVIWRPLHEAAGNSYTQSGGGAWFWWGKYGAEPCKQLWKLLYDQLVGKYGLNNLLWVWTIDVVSGKEDSALEWYPGDEYVDIVGCDIYENNTSVKSEKYQFLVDVTKGKKIVTVSECGNIPSPDESIKAGDKWSWFLVWPGSDYTLNTDAYWKQIMSSDNVYTRESMPSLK